jgi:hypothetical protein
MGGMRRKRRREKKRGGHLGLEGAAGLGSRPKLVAASVEESVLLLPILEKEENENGGAGGLLPLWRKKEKQSVERDKCGGEGGGQAGGDSGGVAESTVERERDLLQKKLGRRLVFSKVWTRFSSSSEHEICSYL